MLSKAEIMDRVEQLLQPLLTAQGVELVDLEFSRPRKGRANLRIFLDRPGGITLEEITRVSRVVSELLDVHDFIGTSYNLEVSSPGLTRALKKPADYERFTGRLARLTLRSPRQGRQVYRGILLGLEEDEVCLKEGEAQLRIPLKDIARARLDIDLKNSVKEA
ncbi:MAG: ribosome maturation factor RimP [Thermodesulfobacteriota bacterium]